MTELQDVLIRLQWQHPSLLVAGTVLGLLMIVVGGGRMVAPYVREWWQSRRRVGTQVAASSDEELLDVAYAVAVVKVGAK